MIGQGYEIKDNVVYQDNISAILMENNGRNSCTGNSRHIHIRCFWVKDRVHNKEVRIENILTHLVLADFFRKSLQGEQFRILRAYMMGWRLTSELLIQKDIKKTDRIKKDVRVDQVKYTMFLNVILILHVYYNFFATRM